MRAFAPSRATLWIVLAHLAVVVPLAMILNVWQDEAYSLQTTGRTLSYAIHQSIVFEQNAPLYFAVLWFWRQVSAGYVWARFFSICCTASTIALVPALVRRYCPQVPAAYVALAVAFNPLTIWAAVEIRSYALAVLLGALLMLTCYDAFVSDERRAYDVPAVVVIATIAAYTQYFILFLVAGFGIVLVAMRSWKALGRYVVACAAIAVLFVPMLLMLPDQLAAFRTAYVGPATVWESVSELGKILVLQVFPVGGTPHRRVIAAAVIAFAAILFVLGRKQFRAEGPYLAPAVLAATSVVYALAVFVLKTHFSFRYGAFLFTPMMLSIFSIPAWWAQPAARRGAAALTALLLLFATVSLGVTYRSGAKIGDWKRVSDYLDANVHGPQPIVVFEAENAVPLAFYYRGPGRIVAVPNAVDFKTYDVDKFVVHNPTELKASLAKLGNPSAIWLVTAGSCRSLNVDYGCDLVNAYVASHYRTVKEQGFFHANVRLLVPRTNATT